MFLGVDPGTKNLGWVIARQGGQIVDCGVTDVTGDSQIDIISNVADFTAGFSKADIKRVIIERQPPRGTNSVQLVAHAVATAFACKNIDVRFKHALRHDTDSYSRRKNASLKLFHSRTDGVYESKQNVVHIADAYNLMYEELMHKRVRLAF